MHTLTCVFLTLALTQTPPTQPYSSLQVTKRRAIVIIAKDAKALSAWAGSTGKDPAYITALAGDDIDVYKCECAWKR